MYEEHELIACCHIVNAANLDSKVHTTRLAIFYQNVATNISIGNAKMNVCDKDVVTKSALLAEE